MGLYYTAPIGNVVNFNFATAYTAPGGSVTNFDFEPPVLGGTNAGHAQGRNMHRSLVIRLIPIVLSVGASLITLLV